MYRKLRFLDLLYWQDIPRKKQGLIFVISYYRITITSEQRYLQGITIDQNLLFDSICKHESLMDPLILHLGMLYNRLLKNPNF